MGRTYRRLKQKDRKKLKDLRRKRQEYRHDFAEENSKQNQNKNNSDS